MSSIFDDQANETRFALGWLEKNVKLAKDSSKHETPYKQGFLGNGSDSVVFRVIINSASYALKLTVPDEHLGGYGAGRLPEAELHRFLHDSCLTGNDQKRQSPVVPVHKEFHVFCCLSRIIHVLHCGNGPTDNEDELINWLRTSGKDTETAHLITGIIMQYCPISVWSLQNEKNTTDAEVKIMYTQLIATLGVLQPLGLTHGDTHSNNLRMVRVAETKAAFELGPNMWIDIPLVVRMGSNNKLCGHHLALSDFGRSSVRSTFQSILPWLGSWHKDLLNVQYTGAVHWPNYSNPGYDMFVAGVHLLFSTPYNTIPSIVIRALIPTMEHLKALLVHLDHYNIDHGLVRVFTALVNACSDFTNVALWNQARDVASRDRTSSKYLWMLPWPPRFYRAPLEALESLGYRPRQFPSPDSKIVRLNHA